MAANIYNPGTAQTTSPPRFPQDPPDEISLFLQQIVLRSSSSSTSFVARRQSFSNLGPGVFPGPGQISAPDPPPALMNSSSGFGLAAANASCSSAGRLDSEADECDYESEEVAEAAAKPRPCRSSSKRSRAAEVHNQSEKRRRSRINEKMKALQNLIPNSNKTDKASMLDEAIEYLKQLQLQVQTLTLRHGLSLYPICLSAHQMKMDPDFIFDSSTHNPTESVSMDHQNISNQLIMLDDKCGHNKQTPIMDFSASKSPFKVESGSSATLNHSATFQCPRSSKKVRICQQVNDDFPVATSRGSKTTSVTSSNAAFGLKESTLEACLVGDGGDHLLQNFVNHPIFSSHLNM